MKEKLIYCATQWQHWLITSMCTTVHRHPQQLRQRSSLTSHISFKWTKLNHNYQNYHVSSQMIRFYHFQLLSCYFFSWRRWTIMTSPHYYWLHVKWSCLKSCYYHVGFVRHCPLHIILNRTLKWIRSSKIPIWTIIAHYIPAYQLFHLHLYDNKTPQSQITYA